jgi:hypothetical protein
VAAKDHHTALRTEVLGKINAGYIEIVLAKLQSGKDDVAFTLHVNPSAFTSGGLQTTDWLRFLGFKENAQCQFAKVRQCFSKEVPEGYDLQRFATAFDEGFGQVQKAEEGLQVCGFWLPGTAVIGSGSGFPPGTERRWPYGYEHKADECERGR